MIAGLARFVEALRVEGVAVSPAELLDASRAVERVGIEDRRRFRTALRATLAKGVRQVEVFDRLFDRFFAPPERGRGERRGERGAGPGDRRGRGRGDSGVPRGIRRQAMEKPPRPARPGRAGQNEAGDRSEQVLRLLEGTSVSASRRTGKLRRAVLEKRSPRSGTLEHSGVEPGRSDVDLALPLTTSEERELARRIPRLIERLRLGGGRRRRRASHGRLWLRKVHRENVASGGIPFVLPSRQPRPRTPRVVLLIDVSHSTARAAGFFLWMAAEFLALDRRTRVLMFVDRPVDATSRLAAWLRGRSGRPEDTTRSPGRAAVAGSRRPEPGGGIRPADLSFAELLRSVPGLNLEAPSDYGRTLHRLLRSQLRPRGRDTVLLVLGDGRTNRFDPLGWAMEEISRGSRTVLWLVPEPRARWGTGDSALASYLPFIDVVVETWSLEGLSRGLAELLRRL